MIAVGSYLMIAASALGGAIIGFTLTERHKIDEPNLPGARHLSKVNNIVAQLTGRKRAGTVRLRKKTVSHQVPKARKRTAQKIDVGDLNEIIAIDPKRRICIANPGDFFRSG